MTKIERGDVASKKKYLDDLETIEQRITDMKARWQERELLCLCFSSLSDLCIYFPKVIQWGNSWDRLCFGKWV